MSQFFPNNPFFAFFIRTQSYYQMGFCLVPSRMLRYDAVVTHIKGRQVNHYYDAGSLCSPGVLFIPDSLTLLFHPILLVAQLVSPKLSRI